MYGLLFLHLLTIHKDRLPGLFPLDCSGKTHKFYMVSPALSFPEGFSLSASFPAVQVLSPQTEAEEYHEKLAESLLKTWTREDRTDPYNTLEMTNLRIQADMEAQKQVMEEIIHPRIG